MANAKDTAPQPLGEILTSCGSLVGRAGLAVVALIFAIGWACESGPQAWKSTLHALSLGGTSIWFPIVGALLCEGAFTLVSCATFKLTDANPEAPIGRFVVVMIFMAVGWFAFASSASHASEVLSKYSAYAGTGLFVVWVPIAVPVLYVMYRVISTETSH